MTIREHRVNSICSFTTFISTLSLHYNTIIDHEAVERLRIQVFTKLKIKKLGITATYWKNMKPCSNSILQNVRQFKKIGKSFDDKDITDFGMRTMALMHTAAQN